MSRLKVNQIDPLTSLDAVPADGTYGLAVVGGVVTGMSPAASGGGGGGGGGGEVAETWDTVVTALSGKVHRWQFEEASGATVADSVGSLNLTLSGTAPTNYVRNIAGPAGVGQATQFISANADSSGMGSVPIGTAQRTIVTIYRSSSILNQVMWGYGDANAVNRLFYQQLMADGRLSTEIGGGTATTGTYIANGAQADGEWHMAAGGMKNTGKNLIAYVDGRYEVGTISTPTAGASNFRVGNSIFGGFTYVGDVADVIVFNRALSRDELDRLYRAFRGVLPGGSISTTIAPITVLRNVADQSLPHSAWTAVNWDTEVIDTLGLHDNSVNPSRITATRPGNLRVTVNLLLSAGTTLNQSRYIAIRKNGVTATTPTTTPGLILSDGLAMLQTSVIIPVVAGDYLEVWTYQFTGSAQTIAGTRNSGEMHSRIEIEELVIGGASSAPSIDNLSDFNAVYGSAFTALDQEFNAISSAALPSGWTWRNQGASTYAERFSRGSVYNPNAGLVGIEKSLTGAPSTWEAIAKISFVSSNVSNYEWGINLTDGSAVRFFERLFGSATAGRIAVWTYPSTFVSVPVSVANVLYDSTCYFSVKKNSATSYDFKLSVDGVGWHSVAAAYNPGITPTFIGVFGFGGNANFGVDWFRMR